MNIHAVQTQQYILWHGISSHPTGTKFYTTTVCWSLSEKKTVLVAQPKHYNFRANTPSLETCRLSAWEQNFVEITVAELSLSWNNRAPIITVKSFLTYASSNVTFSTTFRRSPAISTQTKYTHRQFPDLNNPSCRRVDFLCRMTLDQVFDRIWGLAVFGPLRTQGFAFCEGRHHQHCMLQDLHEQYKTWRWNGNGIF